MTPVNNPSQPSTPMNVLTSRLKSYHFRTMAPVNNPSQPSTLMNVLTSHLKQHNLRALSPINTSHFMLSTIKMSIARPTLRNFRPIYSANNPTGVSLLLGQG